MTMSTNEIKLKLKQSQRIEKHGPRETKKKRSKTKQIIRTVLVNFNELHLLIRNIYFRNYLLARDIIQKRIKI